MKKNVCDVYVVWKIIFDLLLNKSKFMQGCIIVENEDQIWSEFSKSWHINAILLENSNNGFPVPTWPESVNQQVVV